MTFRVLLHPRRALKFLENLPKAEQKLIRKALRELEEDPFTPRATADIKRISTDDGDPVYRLRVGDYRCAYVIVKGEVRVTRIFHRSEGYDWMRRLGLD